MCECGLPTQLKCDREDPLRTGDIVVMYTYAKDSGMVSVPQGLSVVVADQYDNVQGKVPEKKSDLGESFVMGLKNCGLDEPAEDYPHTVWRVRRVKRYEDVVPGENWTAFGFSFQTGHEGAVALAEKRRAGTKVYEIDADEFEALFEPTIKWLAEKFHPHVKAIVTNDGVESSKTSGESALVDADPKGAINELRSIQKAYEEAMGAANERGFGPGFLKDAIHYFADRVGPACTCDDHCGDPCPRHERENQLQDRVTELENMLQDQSK